jgi:hypothetical protein
VSLRTTYVAVACVATATALLISCDRQSPTRATPIQQQPPPSASDTNLTGGWRGAMGQLPDGFVTYISGTNVSITLTQTDSRLEGTLHCDGACLYSAMPVSGTIENFNVAIRGDHPFGSCLLQGTLVTSERMDGDYSCSQEGGVWELWRHPTTTPEPAPCVPDLVLPARGAALDNGRTDFRDAMEWNFDWTDCASADEHSIAILNPGGRNPSVSYSRVSSYDRADCAVFIADHNRFNWRFWVRARVGDYWGAWSPVHTFDVERVDSDPMSSRCPPR